MKFAFVGLFAILTMTACDTDSRQIVRSGMISGGTGVMLVTLEDGTKCAVLAGAYSGSITCNWK